MEKGKEVEPGKVFVGGLSWETSKAGLSEYFSRYGEVTDAVIMVDPVNQKPRGFGFVTFKDPTLVENICSQSHTLDNKTIDPKQATSRTSSSNYAGRVKKIFIGGVSQNTTEQQIRDYFQRFGAVTEVELKYDKATQRMKGFGFVGFDCEDPVEEITRARYHTINGKSVEAKKAEPRNAQTQSVNYSNAPPMTNTRFQPPQSFNTAGYNTTPQNYYNTAYQQQPGYGSYPVGYSSSFGQPSSYGGQQQGYGQQTQGYTQQQQAYAYEAYTTAPRQTAQEQVAATYGHEQAATYGTPRASYTGTTPDQFGQGTAVAGYGYSGPGTQYSAYQDQSSVAAAYGQAPQRSQFPPYGGR